MIGTARSILNSSNDARIQRFLGTSSLQPAIDDVFNLYMGHPWTTARGTTTPPGT